MSSEKQNNEMSSEPIDYAIALLTTTIIELPKMCQEALDKLGLTEEQWEKFKKSERYVKIPSRIDDGVRGERKNDI